MKKVLSFVSVAVVAAILLACQTDGTKVTEDSAKPTLTAAKSEGAINWMTWEEAVKANQKTGKKLFIDFYTDWCGWCKKMDATTFSDPAIAKYINENFHPVKFDAEQKGDIVFQGTTFKFQAGGRRGVHQLAAELLDGRLGYPSYVYLTPKYERILISPGYKPVPDLQKELKFVAEDHFNRTTWEQYRQTN